MTTIYLQHGSATNLPMSTERVRHKVTPLPAHKRGGAPAPLIYMVHFNDRWCRVYERPNGTCFIKNKYERITVTIDDTAV